VATKCVLLTIIDTLHMAVPRDMPANCMTAGLSSMARRGAAPPACARSCSAMQSMPLPPQRLLQACTRRCDCGERHETLVLKRIAAKP